MSKSAGAHALPPKELAIFKRVVKYYDQKQYKNGLKYAKQILSNPKYADHGETLAMKGILLNCLGKKEEARECVKRGLQANISSFVCWHIYGLIQKSDRKYEEAIKCYLQALRLDCDSLQVLRDLSVLQMQLRNYEGCRDTRYKLLMLRPNQRASWIGYAVIYHLLGNYDNALTVLNEFRKSQGEVTPGYETSELVLYQASIMMEAGKSEDALKYLEEFKNQIADVTCFLELKAQILIKSGQLDEACKICWELIDRNPENRSYFELLCQSKSVDSVAPDCSPLKSVYQDIAERYPRSKLAKRLLLNTYTGEEFSVKLDAYLKSHLRKAVPTLFIRLLSLWKQPERLKTLETLLASYRTNISAYNSLQSDPIIEEPPSTCVWLNFLFAQYLSYCGHYQEALDVIDGQLSTTPTLVDFYVLKAEVYSSAGDVITASRWMEEAQSLDTADRYINARCTKLMVQAFRTDEAVAMASKFTRGTSSAAEYLSEMQCMWFLLENARTLKAIRKYGESLKLCHEIEQHYRNIIDDQLDFHSYCLRKGTLRAYVDSLRWEDHLRDHPSYLEVTQLAVEIYLHLFVQPMTSGDDNANDDQAKLNSSEAKKLRNKQRKVAKRAEAEAARMRAEQERREQAFRSRQSDDTEVERQTNQDSALDPYALARPSDPLGEACKFLVPLLELYPKQIEPYCLAYEIYERKNKWLLMLRSIVHGQRIKDSSDDPWFHECCVRFLLKLLSYSVHLKAEPDTYVHRILNEQLPELFPGFVESCDSFPDVFNQAFRKRNASSFPHVFRATLLNCIVEPEKRDHHLAALPSPLDGLENTTWQSCSDCLKLLREAYVGSIGEIPVPVIERFRVACHRKFPMANAFLTQAELDGLRQAMIKAAADTAVCGVYTSYAGGEVGGMYDPNGGVSADGLAQNVESLVISNPDAILVNGDGTDGTGDDDVVSQSTHKALSTTGKANRVQSIRTDKDSRIQEPVPTPL